MHLRNQGEHSAYWFLLLGLVAANLALHSGFNALGLQLDPLRWVFLIVAVMVGAWVFSQGPVRSLRGVGWSIAFFLALTGVTVSISDIVVLSALKWGALIMQVFVLVYFSVHLLSTPQWEQLFSYVFAFTSTVVVLAFGIYLIGHNPFWEQSLWHQGRLAALTNPNSVAIVAALNGIMALWMRERYRKGSGTRNVIFGLLGISLVVLCLTGSRTSGGAFLAGVLAWGWATGNMRWFFLLFGCLSILLVVSESYIFDMVSAFRLEDPTHSRESVWKASYASWLERPWFGYGYGITGQEYAVTSLASAIGSVRDAAGYLGLLESIGLVGATGLLTLYIVALRHVWTVAQLWRRGVRSRELWIALMAGTVFVTLIVHAGGEAWIIAPGGFPHVLMWMSVGGLVFGVMALRAKEHYRNRNKGVFALSKQGR